MEKPFAYYLLRLRQYFTRFCDGELEAMGLTRGLMFFLVYVGRHPGCTPSALAADLGMDTGHTTRSVDKLVQAGLLRRERRPEDRRGFALSLTAQGEAAFARVLALFDQWEDLALSGLEPARRADLTGGLAAILAHLEEV